MSRAAFVHLNARHPDLAARFIEFLLSAEGQRIIAESTPLLPLIQTQSPTSQIAKLIQDHIGTFLTIRLTPSLLTHLDDLKRQNFLSAWKTSLGR